MDNQQQVILIMDTITTNAKSPANSFSLKQGIDGTDTVTIVVPNLANDISIGANIKSNSLNLIFTDDFWYISGLSWNLFLQNL